MLNTLDAHPTHLGNYSLSALLSCGRWAIVRRGVGRKLGRGWGKDWEELLRGRGRWVERYRVESYEVESDRVESGTTKKRALKISLQSSLK